MIRLGLIALISLSLVVAPIAGVMSGTSTHVDHPATVAMSSADGDCLCCQTKAQCSMTSCATQCSQFGPASDPAPQVGLAGRAALSGFEPSTHYGLTSQPPTPPPRA